MTYPRGDTRRFNSYAGHFRRLFGCRVQKLSVDAGFTCPNRDGTIGEGGCTFCNNGAFTPSYCMPSKSGGQQIAEGIEFHGRRYRAASRYLVYFQSFSNTYAPLERLRALYGEALAYPGVAGIVIGTRPDCVDAEKLDYLAEIARDRYVAVEFGIESTCDETLRAVNRGHDFACARRAVEMAAERGLHVGAHFILGLPGETDEMLWEQVATINSLPLTTVKFHQLQVFRGTPMMLQAVFIFYALPYFTDNALRFDNIWAASILIVSINTGAYMAESVRGGIISIDPGQTEGAKAIGMTHFQTMTSVILPQAIRNILPQIGNNYIINVKDTSVMFIIGFTEFFASHRYIVGINNKYFPSAVIEMAGYLAMTLIASGILRLIEKLMDGSDSYELVQEDPLTMTAGTYSHPKRGSNYDEQSKEFRERTEQERKFGRSRGDR